VTVEADFPRGHALGIRRALLHRRMAEEAADAGIDLSWGTAVEGLAPGGVRIGGEIVPCRWVAGADGGNSRVRQWSGLDAVTKERLRFGFRRHYRVAPWSDYMELYWGEGCQVYVTPVAPDRVCVASISSDPRLRLVGALAQFPALSARLARGGPAGAERGALSATRRLRHVCGPGVALVGDASGSVDAITGEGMCVAFQQAQAAAACFAAGTLRGYERAHRSIMRRPSRMAEGLLLAGRFGAARRAGMRAMAERPALFAGMLALHVGGMD
jgi:menaquinone-9 beta-reductase